MILFICVCVCKCACRCCYYYDVNTLCESEWASMSHPTKVMHNAFHMRSTRCMPHLICMDCFVPRSLSLNFIKSWWIFNAIFQRDFSILYRKAIFNISVSNGIEIVGRSMTISKTIDFLFWRSFVAIFYRLLIEFSFRVDFECAVSSNLTWVYELWRFIACLNFRLIVPILKLMGSLIPTNLMNLRQN